MLSQETAAQTPQTQIWPIDKLVFDARNPRKNDSAVDRMCGSIREFGFKIPVLARSDGEVVDGHLRLKAARKLNIAEIPVILCDEWTPAQVKAFRIMVNRSVTWADWDEELLSLELQELNAEEFDLSLTGFNPKEIDDLLTKKNPPLAGVGYCRSLLQDFDDRHTILLPYGHEYPRHKRKVKRRVEFITIPEIGTNIGGPLVGLR